MPLKDFSFHMIHEEERKSTFKFWPFKDNAKCNKAKMAEAGFYSSGKKSEPDFAVCYICCKELDGWEKDDDPWKEHQKHAPHCPFIKLGKKPSMLTLNDLFDLESKHETLVATKQFQELLRKFDEEAESVLDTIKSIQLKENEKPRGNTRRKQSSRK